MLTEKAPYPCCQENPRDCGKFSWIHFEEPDFQQWNSLGDGNGTRQRKQQVNVIRYASDRDRHHRVLARDPAQVSMQSIPHLFPDCRLSSAGAEHQVNQARYVTMRHENQPSRTGLVFLAHSTQHWFGAVPLLSSCTACMRRTVLGYYQVVPVRQAQGRLCGTSRYKQLSQLGGLERNAHRTERLCV